jgi:amino acid transporter
LLIEDANGPLPSGEPPSEERPSLGTRIHRLLFGKPRDLEDRSLLQHISLVAFLAWVGLGADGLSSSSYGPMEAFHALGRHTYLAFGLAALTALTVGVIAAGYSRIIQEFPHGGGGYIVATRLLGKHAGLVSGCALIVDYVLTITVSIAAAGDAIFSFLPPEWQVWKLGIEILLILFLVTLNIRGVKESVLALLPIFIIFLLTHVLLIVAGVILHAGQMPATVSTARQDLNLGIQTLGAGGLLFLFLHAYSLGGGTYTGLEAVSNGLPVMREPRVATARRTMVYMAVSLAFMAGGLLVCYLLWDVSFIPGKTMNAILAERVFGALGLGIAMVVISLLAEGALLIVGAQAGFIDGPRVLANMSVDSWFPHRFSALSERLTIENGILLMGGASLLALLYTRGSVSHLVVMYSINVFLTFSLSMFGMLRHSLRRKKGERPRFGSVVLFAGAFLLCATILVITVTQKFREGGWLTLVVTGALITLALVIRAHYRKVGVKLRELYRELKDIPESGNPVPGAPDPSQMTAVVLVGGFGGIGIHTMLNAFRIFPGTFKNLVFISAGSVESGAFTGEHGIAEFKQDTKAMLEKYVELARRIGVPATYRMAVGTDVVDELEALCLSVAREFPRSIFFGGKVIFQKEGWYHSLLHNETAFAVQKRLQWAGKTMVIIPARMQ